MSKQVQVQVPKESRKFQVKKLKLIETMFLRYIFAPCKSVNELDHDCDGDCELKINTHQFFGTDAS